MRRNVRRPRGLSGFVRDAGILAEATSGASQSMTSALRDALSVFGEVVAVMVREPVIERSMLGWTSLGSSKGCCKEERK